MAIVIDTATILEIWLHILNLHKICGQMIHKTSCLRPVSSNPVLGLGIWNSHNKSYRPDTKIPCSDSEYPLKTESRHKLNHPKQRRSTQTSPDTRHQFIHIGSYSEKFKFPSSDLKSPQNLGLDANWTIQIGGGHPTCSWCLHHYLGYSRCHRPNHSFSFANSWSPWKMGLEAGWTIHIGGGQIFKPSMFRECFAFYSPIRKCTNMGPLDLESPQKSAPDDI